MTIETTTNVRFISRTGEQLEGASSEPSGSSKVGAVVVVHEGHGLNDAIKLHCEQFAQAGFLALAPDLHHGKLATSDQEMTELMRSFDFTKAVSEIGDAIAHLGSHARCNGKIAAVGFSLGGALTLAATKFMPMTCAVPFYGVPRMPPEEFANMKTPICGHYAKVDDWAPKATVEALATSIRSNGGRMDLHYYDAGHSFMRSTDPSKYDRASADLAWQRTLDFLHMHLQ